MSVSQRLRPNKPSCRLILQAATIAATRLSPRENVHQRRGEDLSRSSRLPMLEVEHNLIEFSGKAAEAAGIDISTLPIQAGESWRRSENLAGRELEILDYGN